MGDFYVNLEGAIITNNLELRMGDVAKNKNDTNRELNPAKKDYRTVSLEGMPANYLQ